MLVLLDDTEDAGRRRVARGAGRDRRFREQAVVVVDLDALLLDRDDDGQRALGLRGAFRRGVGHVLPWRPAGACAAAAHSPGASAALRSAARNRGMRNRDIRIAGLLLRRPIQTAPPAVAIAILLVRATVEKPAGFSPSRNAVTSQPLPFPISNTSRTYLLFVVPRPLRFKN